MTEYRFRANSLFNSSATATNSGTEYHDAPAAGEQLAKLKPCAQWIVNQLAIKGIRARAETDEGGWMLSVPAKSGFVLLILDNGTMENQPFQLLVTKIGSSDDESVQVKSALKLILENASIVSDLMIED